MAGRLPTQAAADLLGLKQPDVSAIVTGRTGRFSIDRLVRCLDRLGCGSRSRCGPDPHRPGRRPWRRIRHTLARGGSHRLPGETRARC
ncbi:XRE family transcriptional regulator [Methylobacterium isbiliense]|uniref:XRE family transcriptional regulator n=1 Tax=Methylobacterium isbiliense TaxID=315478 RepID=UPI001EE2C307|nr:XRE family transcriptional regulator [Methylobacterium isbiliense]MDN3622391.1 XRE family transcriptional regulator [Methylobacterium isbiliense]